MDSSRKLPFLYSRGSESPGSSDLSLRRRLPRILVVDDNPNTMNLMQDLLSSRGYDVVAVPDASQAEMPEEPHNAGTRSADEPERRLVGDRSG